MAVKSAVLLTSRRFLPHFLTMFLGAFNDNFYKSALVMLVAYRSADSAGIGPSVLVASAGGVLILPFLIFSSLASSLADRYERSMLIRAIKLAEIAVMASGALAFYIGSPMLMIAVLFAMGTQSAFFGPLKYSVIPTLVSEDELLAANGLIESGTFAAILLGGIFGGISVLRDGGIAIASSCAVVTALLGYIASRYIPDLGRPTRPAPFELALIRGAVDLVRAGMRSRMIFSAVLAVSWFYFVGAVFLAQFPIYARETLHADETVATAMMAIFSIGIGVGSMACGIISRGRITARGAPASALGIAVCGAALYACSPRTSSHGALYGALDFFTTGVGARVALCSFGVSFFAGSYIVPLYAFIQDLCAPEDLARTTACQNVVDSLFIVAASAAVSIALALGMTTAEIFLGTSILTAVAAICCAAAFRDPIDDRERTAR